MLRALLWLVRGTAFALVLATGGTALAFCRTRTCDPSTSECGMKDGCVTSGKPLYWASTCVSFSVNQNGSALRNIDYETANDVVSDAFRRWLGADCDGDEPTLRIWNYGPVHCNTATYNQAAPNANVWSFRDDDWPYASPNATLALTVVTFNTQTGEIFDADVEINSHKVALTTGDSNVDFDLASIVTHEAGHFLGLSHSINPDATMVAGYMRGEIDLRSLGTDDEAGICSLFPPAAEEPSEDCTPRHGFSVECTEPVEDDGCAVHPRPRPPPARTAPTLLLLAVGAFVRRRRHLCAER